MRTTMIAAVLAAGLLLTGCGSGNAVKSVPVATSPVTVTPDVETPEPTEPQDKAVALTDVVTYEHGVEVSLAGFTRGVSGPYAAPENTPYIKFKVKIKNGSQGTMDLSGMYVACVYGEDGREGEQIFDDGLEGTPSTHLRPGRSITTVVACELPKDESYLQVEVTPDAESETAIFAGDVAK